MIRRGKEIWFKNDELQDGKRNMKGEITIHELGQATLNRYLHTESLSLKVENISAL